MNLDDIIKNRRSVFPAQYNQKPIEVEAIKKIVEAANWAPSHKKTEPWRFKILQNDSLRRFAEFVGDCYEEKAKAKGKKVSDKKRRRKQQKFLQSSCVILICMQRDKKERVPEWEEVAATAMAVQNMWLKTAELGIGAYWSSSSLRDQVGEFAKLKKGETCLGFFYMGYYEESQKDGERGNIDTKVDWL